MLQHDCFLVESTLCASGLPLRTGLLFFLFFAFFHLLIGSNFSYEYYKQMPDHLSSHPVWALFLHFTKITAYAVSVYLPLPSCLFVIQSDCLRAVSRCTLCGSSCFAVRDGWLTRMVWVSNACYMQHFFFHSKAISRSLFLPSGMQWCSKVC